MNIFVRRPGEISNRYYPVDKARSKLAQGVLTPNDLAWCKGLSEWGPLSKVLAVAEGRNGDLAPPVEIIPYRVAYYELGAQCFSMVMEFQDSYTSFIRELELGNGASEHLDLGQIWVELICLGTFVIDYAIQVALKYGLKEEVLYAYRAHLKRLRISGVADFYQQIRYRMLLYTSVVNDTVGAPQSLPSKMGETFAAICNASGDQRLERMGRILYENIFGFVTQWIQSIGIENVTDSLS
jgi:hypothetical protein